MALVSGTYTARDDGRGAGEIKAARRPQQVDAKKEKKYHFSFVHIKESVILICFI